MSIIRAITVSGEVGSGKSSVAMALIERLVGWKYVNVGQLFREFCAERGLSIQQVGLLPDSVHREFDQLQKKMLHDDINFLLEGRLAGWLANGVVGVFKIYCIAPVEIRIQRYMRREHCSREQSLAEITRRDEHDVLKYKQLYGVEDYRSPQFYDLQLDTASQTPQELADTILSVLSQS